MAELVFFRDGELQMRFPLRRPRIDVGRSPECDVAVPDRAVSRLQCTLEERGGGWAVVDRSGRGTPVSNRVAHEGGSVLRQGDEIRLGAYTAVFDVAIAADEPEVTAPRARSGKTGPLAARSHAQARARLRVRRPDGETIITLRPEEGIRVMVGKDPTGPVQVELADEFVSASHCRLAFRAGRWVISDLDSKNGTFVDGLRIGEAFLEKRAAIRVGESTILFEKDIDLPGGGEEPLPGLVTRDPAMRPVVEAVRRIAASKVSVAIHGETGVGKEVVARAVHLVSERRAGPFVALNCGALPKDTVESELFGHEKGAFTGADRARPGAFEEADGGTLFLDEIGDLPSAVQVKLLRTLERGEVRRMGSSTTKVVDVRIVSATHRDLVAAVEEGSFREDLFYRLCVMPLEVPPLRQRVQDIVSLAEHFAAALAPGQAQVVFSPQARAKLEQHPWHGNARELKNVVQTALLQRRGPVIAEEDLALRVGPRKRRATDMLRVTGRTMDEIEKEAYRLALERHDGDRKAALEELGVARSTFFRKLDEFGLS